MVKEGQQKIIGALLSSFPLSATILAGSKNAVIEIAFRSYVLQLHRHPDSSMAKIQPFLDACVLIAC